MEINLWINDKLVKAEVAPDTILLDLLREKGCYSVKRGCDTSNCGLCTVLVENKPILSCSYLAVRVNQKHINTIEGLQTQAEEFGAFLADQGGEQCGFCSPGFIMNVIAMTKELDNPSEEDIKSYLLGNLCRCTGYQSQLRAIKNYLNYKKEASK